MGAELRSGHITLPSVSNYAPAASPAMNGTALPSERVQNPQSTHSRQDQAAFTPPLTANHDHSYCRRETRIRNAARFGGGQEYRARSGNTRRAEQRTPALASIASGRQSQNKQRTTFEAAYLLIYVCAYFG